MLSATRGSVMRSRAAMRRLNTNGRTITKSGPQYRNACTGRVPGTVTLWFETTAPMPFACEREADVERQIQQDRDEEQRQRERHHLHQQVERQRAHADEVADRRGGDDNEGQRRDVPRVEERQAADDDAGRDQRERPLDPECDIERLRAAEERERNADSEQHERQRHHVRMEVAEDEAEHRELGDHAAAVVVERIDARGVEEAEEVTGVPAVARDAGRQALHIDPMEESAVADAVRRHELQHADEIAHDRRA